MVSFGASAGFRLTLAVQDTSQLEHRYGREVARTLMNNMQNFTYLMGGDNETLKTVSEKAGKRLIWDEERSNYEEKPVISTERLSNLSVGEALTLQLRRNPILTRLLGHNQYYFYKYMPTGNADKPHKLENVRYFDLVETYRKRESAKIPVQEAKKEQQIIPKKKKQIASKAEE